MANNTRLSWDNTAERAAEVQAAMTRVLSRAHGSMPFCIPAPHDMTLCEELGLVMRDVSDEYSAAIREFLTNGHKNKNSYDIMCAKLAGLGRIKGGKREQRSPLVVRAALDIQDDAAIVRPVPPKMLVKFANALRTAI